MGAIAQSQITARVSLGTERFLAHKEENRYSWRALDWEFELLFSLAWWDLEAFSLVGGRGSSGKSLFKRSGMDVLSFF